MYKVLVKILVNILMSAIYNVVPESHSTFMKGRQILNGIVIANKLIS